MKLYTKHDKKGSNQYQAKKKGLKFKTLMNVYTLLFFMEVVAYTGMQVKEAQAYNTIGSPIPLVYSLTTAGDSAKLKVEPTPSELENIVAYIARKYEPYGKDAVVQAINCFYSESGLRANAVGQNTDGPKSKDWGVAQLNDYWHKLTPAQKSNYKANIDKSVEIFEGRGENFTAWYGKRCN